MMENRLFLSMYIMLLEIYMSTSSSPFIPHQKNLTFQDTPTLIEYILSQSPYPSCSLILIVEKGCVQSKITNQVTLRIGNISGLGVFEINLKDDCNNCTDANSFDDTIKSARKFRQISWNTMVIVISEDQNFLSDFAESSLQSRLLIWTTRLLVLTSLHMNTLQQLISSYWTFSMMNTMILNYEDNLQPKRWSIYTHLPYSDKGKQMIRVSSWNLDEKPMFQTHLEFFPEKYSDFHGAVINITALDYSPYWVTVKETTEDGKESIGYKGADANLLKGISKALNFKFYNIPTKSWSEVAQLVTERASFMATVIHYVLPDRMDSYDYSHAYNFEDMAFANSKPSLIPKWQSLYYPLSQVVWLSILIVCIIIPLVLYIINHIGFKCNYQKKVDIGLLTETVLGSLLSQSVHDRLPNASSLRMALATWFVFAFIAGAAYRGNLIASLTLPKYPPRPESLAQLVKTTDKILAPAYGADFLQFFLMSESKIFQKAAEQMEIGAAITEGLGRSITKNEAFLDSRSHMEMKIANEFTRADGSTPLYVGREGILPGLSAWPIVFDAPYKPQLDRMLMYAVEGGLFRKWRENEVEDARLNSRKRQRNSQHKEDEPNSEGVENNVGVFQEGSSIKLNNIRREDELVINALTITQVQGPFMVLIIGTLLATISFLVEFFNN